MYGTGFHMVVVPELPHQDPMDPVRYVVETRSADAIILNRITPDDPRVSYLLEKGFPFATHGRAKISDRHPYFDYDNATFAALAVRLMGDRSRRNCLLIAPPQDQSYAYDLVRGARDTGRDIGIALTVADITSDDPVDEIARHVEIAFERDPSLDSVIAASPHAAIAAVGVVGRAGHTIGKTMDICAKETIGILEMLKDSVLTIHEDIDRAGSFLARAAIASVKRPQDPPMQALDKPLSPTPRR
jgi:LacI family transcriptional regulator